MNINDRLKNARAKKDISLGELAKTTGIAKSTLQRYETGTTKKIPIETIPILEKALNVPTGYLMGWEQPTQITADSFPSPNITDDYVTFPVMGEIAAGYDNIAVENWEGEKIDIPVSHLKGRPQSDYFVLNVKGDSMYPLYHNNDKVLILKQSTMDNSGDIGAVIYDDEYATLKKVEYKQGENWVRLVPINPEYQPKTITDEQLEHCRVIGVPKLLIREIII